MLKNGIFARLSFISRRRKQMNDQVTKKLSSDTYFQRLSSPHFIPSSPVQDEDNDDSQDQYHYHSIKRRDVSNLNFSDSSYLRPYSYLPNPSRSAKRAKNLSKAQGHFHCSSCKKRYESEDVWVTKSTGKCVQSVECAHCYAPNRPYYISFPKPNIFSMNRAPAPHRYRRGKFKAVPSSYLTKLGY